MKNREIILQEIRNASAHLFDSVLVEVEVQNTKNVLLRWQRWDFLKEEKFLPEEWREIEKIQQRVDQLESAINKYKTRVKPRFSFFQTKLEKTDACVKVFGLDDTRNYIFSFLYLAERSPFRHVCRKWKNGIDSLKVADKFIFPYQAPELIFDMSDKTFHQLLTELHQIDYYKLTDELESKFGKYMQENGNRALMISLFGSSIRFPDIRDHIIYTFFRLRTLESATTPVAPLSRERTCQPGVPGGNR